MKSISTALKSHMAQTATTLAACWLIVRQGDGQQFAFTAFDEDLTVSGVTYKSISSFTRSAIATGSTGDIDNLEVVGIFGTTAGTIQESDQKAGLFRYATIYMFCVNWADLTQGICKLRRGWIGSTIRAPDGTFRAEIRGLTQNLSQEFGNVYSPLCRADLGDSKCKVPIIPAKWQATHSQTTGDYIAPATQTTDALKTAIFKATTTGTTGSTEPAWNTTVGATTTDGGVTWLCVAAYRQIGSVSALGTQHQFTSSGLSSPAATSSNIGWLEIRADGNSALSAGTSISVSDGVNTYTWTAVGDTRVRDAWATIEAGLLGSALAMSYTFTSSGFSVELVNNSGHQGSIQKTGDTSNSIVIQNFTENYYDGGTLTWITGNNAGISTEIKTVVGTLVVLWEAANFTIQVGDTFFYYPGCDKSRTTCWTKFQNSNNFRGEPDMPGLDAILAYPDPQT